MDMVTPHHTMVAAVVVLAVLVYLEHKILLEVEVERLPKLLDMMVIL